MIEFIGGALFGLSILYLGVFTSAFLRSPDKLAVEVREKIQEQKRKRSLKDAGPVKMITPQEKRIRDEQAKHDRFNEIIGKND